MKLTGAWSFSLRTRSAWALDALFSARAAYLHIGAMTGTVRVEKATGVVM